jgi:oxygen-dependent protoporphyrinogen oxidase
MTMPRFLDLEAADGSVTRGLRRARSSPPPHRPFGHGTGRGGFVAVEGASRASWTRWSRVFRRCVHLGARVAAVGGVPATGDWSVRLTTGETIAAGAVVLTCPAEDAALALRALDDPLADALLGSATPPVPRSASPTGGPTSARGSRNGFFVPRTEACRSSCSYVSEKYEGRAPVGSVVFRAFLGGATNPEALDGDDAALIRRTDHTLRRVREIGGPPLLARVHRSPRSMPQFEVGAREGLAKIQGLAGAHPGLFLAGSAAGAFGLSDCIRSGEDAAEKAAAFLSTGQRAPEPSAGLPRSSAWVAYQANQNA